ncbi:type V CRISPR-associated endonuclease Cas1 [Candidatus Gracilibacteria bacterium]|nr:type V CRISPR-associated endonuclease Cas1 [Candidatus Gracilibacteria bacterium]
MLSKPDFIQKQILIIHQEKDIQLDFKFSNDNIIIYKNSKIANKISLHKIFVIFIIGSFTITSNLIAQANTHCINIFLLKENFQVQSQIQSYASGNFLLRYQQYHHTTHHELFISQCIVLNKITNQIHILQKYNHIDSKKARALLTKTTNSINHTIDYKELLGIEGTFAKTYFSALFDQHEWTGRKPRAKNDINNLLLDIGYTYILNFIDSLLLLYGFDTYKGVYHKLFFQRKSLSCDIIEPFRPMIDYYLIKAHNLNQINPKDFQLKSPTYSLPWKNSRKYTTIFFDGIMQNKESIYDYVQKYYRFNMNPTDNPMPQFIFKPR